MAQPKKGALHQIVIPMVDATDFASVESGITESDFNSGATRKFWGWNTGVSDATTSGSISKTGSLVRSGVFRLTLKATENNYDMMMVRVNKTGCAEQIWSWSNLTNDDSDIRSALTVVEDIASDAHSAAVQTNSRVLLNQSRISDVASYLVALSGLVSDVESQLDATQAFLSDFQSDFVSKVPKAAATASALSDFHSDFASRVPKEAASKSLLSDVHSDLRSYMVGVSAHLSNVESQLTAFSSDVLSRVPSVVPTASGLSALISDVISAVVAAPNLTRDAIFSKTFSEPTTPPDFTDDFEDIIAKWHLIAAGPHEVDADSHIQRNMADDADRWKHPHADNTTTYQTDEAAAP